MRWIRVYGYIELQEMQITKFLKNQKTDAEQTGTPGISSDPWGYVPRPQRMPRTAESTSP